MYLQPRTQFRSDGTSNTLLGQVSRAGGFSSIVLMASAALAVWYFLFRKKPQSRKRTARHGVRVAPLPR